MNTAKRFCIKVARMQVGGCGGGETKTWWGKQMSQWLEGRDLHGAKLLNKETLIVPGRERGVN